MAALERIPPQLGAPQEAILSPPTTEEEPERAEPHPASREASEVTERRSWWRRIFGQ
jgi:hypothetical protein